jgi:hypothetical protein
VKKTVHKRNRRNKACEPALYTHARQEVPKDELGTYEDPRWVDSVGMQLMPNGPLTSYKRRRSTKKKISRVERTKCCRTDSELLSLFLFLLLPHRVPVQVSRRLVLFVERPECVLQHLRPVLLFLCVVTSRVRHLFAALFALLVSIPCPIAGCNPCLVICSYLLHTYTYSLLHLSVSAYFCNLCVGRAVSPCNHRFSA